MRVELTEEDIASGSPDSLTRSAPALAVARAAGATAIVCGSLALVGAGPRFARYRLPPEAAGRWQDRHARLAPVSFDLPTPA